MPRNPQKPVTKEQRKRMNENEHRRVCTMKEQMEKLKRHIPCLTIAQRKKLPTQKCLKLATAYIEYLKNMLDEKPSLDFETTANDILCVKNDYASIVRNMEEGKENQAEAPPPIGDPSNMASE